MVANYLIGLKDINAKQWLIKDIVLTVLQSQVIINY